MIMTPFSKKFLTTIFCLSLFSGCTSNPYTGERQLSKSAEGAGVGAAIGALTGAIVGKLTNTDTRRSLLVGAGIGALTGAVIGDYQDKQEAELRKLLQDSGVGVTRSGDSIILHMPEAITFSTDSDAIKSEFYSILNSVSLVLSEFDQTLVDINGHTDSDGDPSYNQRLSERRALNVGEYLIHQGNDRNRFYVTGYGESRPIASNSDSFGKSLNRRVELEIMPLTTR